MKTSLRFLVGAVAVATVSLSMSACDASPYAASVNGHVISVLSLNTRLGQFTSNKAYLAAQKAAAAQSGTTESFFGSGSGTYATSFASNQLGQMVLDSILEQHLAATGQLPDAEMLAVARGVFEVQESQNFWYDFPDQTRNQLVDSLAYEAAILGPSSNTTALKSLYAQAKSYFFTQVCVRQASASSLSAAQAAAAAGVSNGADVCYSQVGLEDQPAAFRAAVQPLAVGQVTKPVATSYGYEVAKVTSKSTVAYGTAVIRVLTVIIDSESQIAEPSIGRVLAAAKVKINPAYGTWSASTGSVTPPTLKSS